MIPDDGAFAANTEQRWLLALARQEIEQLRRWYAVATDLLGRGTEADDARGVSIYRRIFTEDAQVSVRGSANALSATGPDGWAAIARQALAAYESTQHLIGTQVVTFTEARFSGAPARLEAGAADMSSYLQAWHAWPDRRLRLVLGTYEDSVRLVQDVGWQIERMVLCYESGEQRMLGTPP